MKPKTHNKPMKNTKISGVILIIIGLLILLHTNDIDILSWYFIRSYGFLLIGTLLFARGLSHPSRKGIYSGTFLLLTGAYFTFGLYDFYMVTRGLSLCIIIIALGLSFYSLFIFKASDWGYLLYGNVVMLIGLFFLLEYLKILPSYLLVYGVDRFWPALLILLGLIMIIHALIRKPQLKSD